VTRTKKARSPVNRSPEAMAHELVEAIAHGNHGDPFAVLGPHPTEKGVAIRAMLPDAARVWVIAREDERSLGEMERIHPNGFYSVVLDGAEAPLDYRLRIETGHDARIIEDPYRFPPVLGETDVYLLAEGTHQDLYRRLGAHPMELAGHEGVAFAVWAPNASQVSVIGDFNGWDGRCHPMRRRIECGVWELFIPGLDAGQGYKFEIKGPGGEILPLKADPLAFYCERPPLTASRIQGLPDREWRDEAWLAAREAASRRDAPISIYECHLGSWMRVPEEGARYLSYAELGERLVPYVKELGFTHIELLPITEHPFDGSWGYQPIGLFAPTSRHGTPGQFAAFVERCHQEGLGVILDWVPGHFPTDAHGLGLFDGTHLYEHADPRQGFHLDWNTLIYNFGRREVANFLLSSALYWLDCFHLDGLRVDAVASMLYLDYSREAGQWLPNVHGGRENLEAIDFLRRMNELAYSRFPGIATVAEESTAWPGVSQPTHSGGLGFGYKWNMGWMHDTLVYMSKDPVHRRWHHNQMTFGMVYAFSENFVLPLSHDEVVHGKGSLLGKMPGDRWQKFANLRAYFGYMFAHPGKKLLFMGGELAQEREWNHDASLDWHLLDDPSHRGMQSLIRDLNAAYRSLPALHELDCEPGGFDWVEGGDAERSVFAFLRYGRDPAHPVLAVSNFTPVPQHGYRLGVPYPGYYREVVNSDAAIYGGSNLGNAGGVWAEPVPSHGQPYSLQLTLPPLGSLLLSHTPG
jgi:1,4-alpha-glucan branching enzyme